MDKGRSQPLPSATKKVARAAALENWRCKRTSPDLRPFRPVPGALKSCQVGSCTHGVEWSSGTPFFGMCDGREIRHTL